MVKHHPDNLVRVHGIMRLAVKYDVEVVRGEIIKRIEADWPSTFDEWSRREREMKGCNYHKFPEPAAAVRFAMEFDCPRILRAALYELARVTTLTEWNPPNQLGRPARWSLLDAADFRRVLKGQKHFSAIALKALQEWRTIPILCIRRYS